MELEQRIKDWEYWCPRCKNRTCGIVIETPNKIKEGEEDGDTRYLSVRVLTCNRCIAPTVLGTYTYHNSDKGWDARGSWYPPGNWSISRPNEYLAFQEPVSERELPKTLPKKVKTSFREAEFAVAHRKPIAAAAAMRNTIRLFVKSEGIELDELKAAIKQLNIANTYQDALGNLKIVGDHTLHFEEYSMAELTNALEVLYLALTETYRSRERLHDLTKAVGDKASKRGRDKEKP